MVECHRADEVEYLQEEAAKKETWMEQKIGQPDETTPEVTSDD